MDDDTMPIDQDIEPGELFKETDTDRAFKVMEVSSVSEQAKVLYIDDIEGEQVVDTRGVSEFKPLDVIKRRLAEGSLVRVGADPYRETR